MRTENRKLAMDPQELSQLLVARANAGDVDGMVALYEPSAVLAIGGGNVAVGAAQIRGFIPTFWRLAFYSTLAINVRRC